MDPTCSRKMKEVEELEAVLRRCEGDWGKENEGPESVVMGDPLLLSWRAGSLACAIPLETTCAAPEAAASASARGSER